MCVSSTKILIKEKQFQFKKRPGVNGLLNLDEVSEDFVIIVRFFRNNIFIYSFFLLFKD